MIHFAIPLGALLGLLGVAAGAFGAHSLKVILSPEMLQAFEVGVRYQLYHALALVAVGALARQRQTGAYTKAVCAFLIGILLFSGSLYLMALTGIRWFGAMTPAGGVAFLAGWAYLAWGSWVDRPR
ncbi:hypothetical protein YTPLAS18_19610 [Nitrospira sp.]|nr:hypothetical protein YTPLAS18_19610 [Nitrospira sp.]